MYGFLRKNHDQAGAARIINRGHIDGPGRLNDKFKILEENDDEEGRLYQQAKERQQELDAEHVLKSAELAYLGQNRHSGGAGAIELLDHLPETSINLVELPADRLTPLLDAFAIQIHYKLQDNSVRIEAMISAEAVPHLARLATDASHHHPTRAPIRPHKRTRARAVTSTNAAVPADDGGDSRFLQIYDMPRRGHRTVPWSNLLFQLIAGCFGR